PRRGGVHEVVYGRPKGGCQVERSDRYAVKWALVGHFEISFLFVGILNSISALGLLAHTPVNQSVCGTRSKKKRAHRCAPASHAGDRIIICPASSPCGHSPMGSHATWHDRAAARRGIAACHAMRAT